MQWSEEWQIPPEFQPDPKDLAYDLEAALSSVVALRASVAEDAFTAETLGTERFGQGVVIRGDGLVLTIGYLITEAQEVWLTANDGRVVPAHALAYDYASGFGLVRALAPLGLPAMALGDSRRSRPGNGWSWRGQAGAEGASRRRSWRAESPAIGNTSSAMRSSRLRPTRIGEARRSSAPRVTCSGSARCSFSIRHRAGGSFR